MLLRQFSTSLILCFLTWQSFYKAVTTFLNVSKMPPAMWASEQCICVCLPPPPPAPHIQRSVSESLLFFPILSVGSPMRQLNAQTVAGPLPKSISSAWRVRPHGQRVLASESSRFLKSSRQGRGACAVCCREAMGLTWPEKKTTVNGSERHPGKDNVFAGANIGLLINTPLSHCFYITALHASWDICTLAVSSKSIFRQTKDGERTNRCCCSDSNVSTRASAGFVCSYKRSSLSHTENKTNGWERGRDRGRERVRQDKKSRQVKTISYTHAAT